MHEKGIDKVEFLLSVNPGQDLRSLFEVNYEMSFLG